MILNSWRFVLFFAAVFALYWACPHKYRRFILLVSNAVFSLSWGIQGTLVVLGVALISFFAGLGMERFEKNKKKIRTAAVAACILNLFVFKYLDFAIGTLESVASCFSIEFHPETMKILLPLGISYYTLQAIGYISDVYREKIPAEHDVISHIVFISFFPQMTSGPISRAGSILPQIKEERFFDYQKADYAIKLIGVGLFKKLVVADNLAIYVNRVFSSATEYTGFSLLLAQCLYLIQLYGDFGGYSDIAFGVAGLLGIDIPRNFNKSPYFATTINEFWTRWHLSLSGWLKDYVYIPLGGSRKGKLRKYVNLMITFFVSGLWHGADWSFVLWGAVHWVYQTVEGIFHIKNAPLPPKDGTFRVRSAAALKRCFKIIFMFILAIFAQIFFRAESVADAVHFIGHMFNGIQNPVAYINDGLLANNWIQGGRLSFGIRLILCVVPLFIYDVCTERFDVIERVSKLKKPIRISIYLLVIAFICFFRSVDGVSFVYFQF